MWVKNEFQNKSVYVACNSNHHMEGVDGASIIFSDDAVEDIAVLQIVTKDYCWFTVGRTDENSDMFGIIRPILESAYHAQKPLDWWRTHVDKWLQLMQVDDIIYRLSGD